jgi:hypothetical protein
MSDEPEATRVDPKRGWLRHGNPPGDPNTAPRCTAHAKTTGQRCRGPAVRGRTTCRMHGGTSRGPKTAEGLERSRKARWKHGLFSKQMRDLRRADRQDVQERVRALIELADRCLESVKCPPEDD